MEKISDPNKLNLMGVAIKLDDVISRVDEMGKTDDSVMEALDYFKVWQSQVQKLIDKLDKRLVKMENSLKKKPSKR